MITSWEITRLRVQRVLAMGGREETLPDHAVRVSLLMDRALLTFPYRMRRSDRAVLRLPRQLLTVDRRGDVSELLRGYCTPAGNRLHA
ncbi:MAG: hypothetical protein V3S25_09740 [Nitrospirales bacterium]